MLISVASCNVTHCHMAQCMFHLYHFCVSKSVGR
jgi:hypothetical protein